MSEDEKVDGDLNPTWDTESPVTQSQDDSQSPQFSSAQLSSPSSAQSALHSPAPSGTNLPVTTRLPLLPRADRYQMIRQIGSGGMGAVYLAQQDRPRRLVAVKVMHARLSSEAAQRRFEYESQVLARLTHAAIAKVYDADVWHQPDGPPVPFFAMEYVENARTLTEYVADKALNLTQKIDLFLQVCDAVHYGHQRGVIHRDLKPGNILVDPTGQVKIIDFGVARATDADLSLNTMQTQAGQIVGTLQYMSPEQAAADPDQLDVRTDVYSLGMILHELVSGHRAYELKGLPLHEAVRVIREHEPSRLSSIDRTLRGDIETIILKALSKERERRYQSALALAEDLERYLSSEPITARKPSMMYQVRLFARRNKPLVAGMTAAVLALALGLAGTLVGLFRANEATDLANTEASRANAALADLKHETAAAAFRAAETAYQRAAFSEAVRQYDRAIELGYDDPIEARIRKVEALNNLGRGIQARDEALKLDAIEDLGDHRATVTYVLALAQYATAGSEQEMAKVIAGFEAALEAGLDPRRALMARGIIAPTMDQAIDHFEQVVQLAPFEVGAHQALATYYMLSARPVEARRQMRILNTLLPESETVVVMRLIELLAYDGDIAAARELLADPAIPDHLRQMLGIGMAMLDEIAAFPPNLTPQQAMARLLPITFSIMARFQQSMGFDPKAAQETHAGFGVIHAPPFRSLTRQFSGLLFSGMLNPAAITEMVPALHRAVPCVEFAGGRIQLMVQASRAQPLPQRLAMLDEVDRFYQSIDWDRRLIPALSPYMEATTVRNYLIALADRILLEDHGIEPRPPRRDKLAPVAIQTVRRLFDLGEQGRGKPFIVMGTDMSALIRSERQLLAEVAAHFGAPELAMFILEHWRDEPPANPKQLKLTHALVLYRIGAFSQTMMAVHEMRDDQTIDWQIDDRAYFNNLLAGSLKGLEAGIAAQRARFAKTKEEIAALTVRMNELIAQVRMNDGQAVALLQETVLQLNQTAQHGSDTELKAAVDALVETGHEAEAVELAVKEFQARLKHMGLGFTPVMTVRALALDLAAKTNDPLQILRIHRAFLDAARVKYGDAAIAGSDLMQIWAAWLLSTGRKTQAVERLSELMEAADKPNLPDREHVRLGRAMLAMALQRLGRYDEARTVAQRAVEPYEKAGKLDQTHADETLKWAIEQGDSHRAAWAAITQRLAELKALETEHGPASEQAAAARARIASQVRSSYRWRMQQGHWAVAAPALALLHDLEPNGLTLFQLAISAHEWEDAKALINLQDRLHALFQEPQGQQGTTDAIEAAWILRTRCLLPGDDRETALKQIKLLLPALVKAQEAGEVDVTIQLALAAVGVLRHEPEQVKRWTQTAAKSDQPAIAAQALLLQATAALDARDEPAARLLLTEARKQVRLLPPPADHRLTEAWHEVTAAHILHRQVFDRLHPNLITPAKP